MPKCDVNNHAVQGVNSNLLYVCMSITLDMSVMPGKDCMTENPGCSILHASREFLHGDTMKCYFRSCSILHASRPGAPAWRHHEVHAGAVLYCMLAGSSCMVTP